MAKITTEFSMSLDGYVAHLDDGIEQIFDWYFDGDVEVPTPTEGLTFRVAEANARHIHESWPQVGCLISGRRLFDLTNGWGGHHPVDAPVVVVTHRGTPGEWVAEHPDAPFTFVRDVETAVATAKGIAGDKDVGVAGPNIVQQVINLGLMDEICVSLVPFLIGKGIPFFGDLVNPPVRLAGPRIVEGSGVTHLYYTVIHD
jgi:dihydrofolate reductase